MEWLIKKRKAFDQRGDMAIAAWAEQQQREMNLRARRLSRSKVSNNTFLTTQISLLVLPCLILKRLSMLIDIHKFIVNPLKEYLYLQVHVSLAT